MRIATLEFMIEILLAELIYLYSADKRPKFWLRFAATVLVCLVAGAFFPIPYTSLLAQFLLFFLLFMVSVVGMYVCFDLPWVSLFAYCSAGYATEHICFHVVKILRFYHLLPMLEMDGGMARMVYEAICFPVLYLLFFFTLGWYVKKHECYKNNYRAINILAIITLVLCIGLTRLATYLGDDQSVTVSVYAIFCCLLMLVLLVLLSRMFAMTVENQTIRSMWDADRRQYELSKQTVETINIKYHDLKHTLRNMNLPQEEVDSIKKAVKVYGAHAKTGNDALDVLLTENSLRCSEKGITLTFTGNGEDLSFMSATDVYSLFGNAISNAVEAVDQLDDPEKKVVDILTEKRGNLVNITFSNFFKGELEVVNGLPKTSKTEEQGFHGFGMRSMQLMAEKYGGSLTARTEGDLFVLTVYLMKQ